MNMRISLDGYGIKIQKVSKCRPTVSNETIWATKQEFFLTKLDPVLLMFWLILLPWMFISSYITCIFSERIFFFWMFIFQWKWHSNVFSFRNRPSINYACTWGNGGAVMQNVHSCVQGKRGWKIDYKIHTS